MRPTRVVRGARSLALSPFPSSPTPLQHHPPRPPPSKCVSAPPRTTRRRIHSTAPRPDQQPSQSKPTPSPPTKRKPLLQIDNTPSRHRTQYNVDPFSLEPPEEHRTFPLVTAAHLARSHQRPRRVRMLSRDFIDDALYNPHYGYFSRHAVLLPDEPGSVGGKGSSADAAGDAARLMSSGFDFASFRTELDFMEAVERRYAAFEASLPEVAPSTATTESVPRLDEADRSGPAGRRALGRRPPQPTAGTTEMLEAAQRRSDVERQRLNRLEEGDHDREVRSMVARQVWHTPTELFKPHYAHSVARFILSELDGRSHLPIYEFGAGSGALAADVLTYLREAAPEVYARCHYHIVEISERLSRQQRRKLLDHGHAGRFTVHNENFLEWDRDAETGAFVIGLEVLDNLAHDVVRYSTATLQPYQSHVSIDATGDMHELWTPATDALILRYLALSGSRGASTSRWLRRTPATVRSLLASHMPFYPNLSAPHYLPTGSLRLLDVLARHFPRHRLLLSDFDSLPDAVEGGKGVGNPVVQTRIQGETVAVGTLRVLQGFFDIFFPSDFAQLGRVYERVMEEHHGGGGSGGGAVSGASAYGGGDGTGSAATSTTTRRPQVFTHRGFLEKYAETSRTRLGDGSNPMLGWYQNAKWFVV